MDIEGDEERVLPKSEEYLPQFSYLFVEYHSQENDIQCLDEILAVIRRAGFRVHVIPEMVSYKPFIERRLSYGFDMQLNIFAWRENGA